MLSTLITTKEKYLLLSEISNSTIEKRNLYRNLYIGIYIKRIELKKWTQNE